MIDREKLIIFSKYERTCDMNDISVNIFPIPRCFIKQF